MKHLIFSFYLLISSLYGDSFFEANDAIGRQEYVAAIDHLSAIPGHSFAKYFNLGDAYLQQGDEVSAWIAFERARNLAPYRSALEPAYQSLPTKPKPLIPLFSTKFYADLVTSILLVLFVLFCGFAIWRRSKFCYALLWLLVFSSAGYYYYVCQSQQLCIVARNEAPMRISPTEQASVLLFLERGKSITAMERHGDFLLAKLPQGKNGWIALQDVTFILPQAS